jgi:iron complex outermembrane receptor protein
LALIQSAALNGLLSTSIGKVTSLTASASRELGDWFGASRPAALALGAEFRHEDYRDFNHHDFAVAVSASTGVDPDAHAEGTRNISAVYGELNVPLHQTLDLTASVRYDKFSDFGNTTNPKLAFRFQPTQEFLMRGSLSTGFRAPSLYDLHQTQAFTNTNNVNNPILCPNGVPVNPGVEGGNCGVQFQRLLGGNPDLQPEKSKNATLGFVFQPIRNTKVTVDFWWTRIKDTISAVPEETITEEYNDNPALRQYIHFLPGNILSGDSRSCGFDNGVIRSTCGYIDTRLNNLGGTNTNGVDLSAEYSLNSSIGHWNFSYSGTYVTKYEYQDYAGGPWKQNVGRYEGAGPIFRQQHNADVRWTRGEWGAGLSLHFKSGYTDANPVNIVDSYTTIDAFANYEPIKNLKMLLGVRNLMDKDPPYTNQGSLFQGGGWDSRYYDPVGRTWYVRMTYKF